MAVWVRTDDGDLFDVASAVALTKERRDEEQNPFTREVTPAGWRVNATIAHPVAMLNGDTSRAVVEVLRFFDSLEEAQDFLDGVEMRLFEDH